MDEKQLTDLLHAAATHHQSGRLSQAQSLYAQVLGVAPRNPEANHNTAVLAMQSGRGMSVALPYFRTAWEADPGHLQHWLSYLKALMHAGAEADARQVLEDGQRRGLRGPDLALLKPRTAPAAAPPSAPAQSVDLSPHQAKIEGLLAQARFSEAETAARAVSVSHPQQALGWKMLGAALRAQQRDSEALGACERAAALAPADALAQLELGQLLLTLGLFRESELAIRRALALDARQPAWLLAYAAALMRLYRYADAEAATRHALALQPTEPAAFIALGEALLEQDRAGEAERAFRDALQLKPDSVDAYRRLGQLLFLQGREIELCTLARQILAATPDYFDAQVDLARSLLRSGDLNAAAAAFGRALQLRPADLPTRESWLFCTNYLAELRPAELLAEAREYGRRASALARPYGQWNCPAVTPLRIGLVSGDLREHPVGYFLEPLLANSDPARIQFLAYPTNRSSDGLSERLQARCAGWKSLAGLSDEDCARLIHADAPHILIDLAGHSADNRLSMFAWRPAPLQLSWLGYFATTGLDQMDYFLADETGVPEAARQFFGEEIAYLPDTRLCFSPPQDAPAIADTPALRNGYVTFGSFQATRKLNDAVLAAWARILAEVPEARLRIQSDSVGDAQGRAAFEHRASAQGIDLARLQLHATAARAQYLRAHAEVDILLDSFPFPGGTTTCEALWMGVPTLTLAGETLVARQGASLLGAAGLADWIVSDVDAYVRQTGDRAADVAGLQSLRLRLREQVRVSPLFDAKRFARAFETLLENLWKQRSRVAPSEES